MNEPLTIYIDFDHTIFDTENFVKALIKSIEHFGIKSDHAYQVINDLRKHKFSLEAFVSLISNDIELQKRMMEVLQSCSRDSGCFLYPDAAPFLTEVRKKGARVVLFTYGDESFQSLKIEGAKKAGAVFDEVMITNNKAKDSNVIQINGPTVVIDDRDDVIEHYASINNVISVLIKRDSTIKQEGVFQSLDQVLFMLKNKSIICKD